MRAGETFTVKAGTGGTFPVSPQKNSPGVIQGGFYRLTVVTTTGTIALSRLGPDQSTEMPVYMQADASAPTAAPVSVTSGSASYTMWLEPGMYVYTLSVAVCSFSLTRIPTSE